MGHTDASSTDNASEKLASIDDFVGRVLAYREQCTVRKSHELSRASISECGLACLLRLAYYTSQVPEEGRFLRFRCHVPAGEKPQESHLRVSFTPRVPIDTVNDLRKLAPVAGNPESALCITESDGRLFCDGVVYTRSVHTAEYIGRIEFDMTSQPQGLWLSVDGPGEIQVHDTHLRHDLLYRSGEVSKLASMFTINAVKSWTDEAGRAITCPDSKYIKTAADLFKRMWCRILTRIVDARHGGAILVVPKESDPSNTQDLKTKVGTSECNLRDRITAFWESSLPVGSADEASSQGNQFISTWFRERERLLQTVEAISDLANVDGCVVFRRDLSPVGFGAEITVASDQGNGEQAEVSCRRLDSKNSPSRTKMLNEFGTRHRSALRFCWTHPNTLAFIVSQDGDLRVATSDDEGNTMLIEGAVATYW